MPVKLSVIIVSYNSEDFIETCIISVLENLPKDGEVIVIDNASTDNTIDKISNFQLIQNKENLGFSKANNLAAKEAKGEYLFFLNPDTEILKRVQNYVNFFDELINFCEKTSDCGLVAPKLIMRNGQVQPSVRKLPTVLGAFKEYILGIKNAYSEYVPEGGNPQEVEMVYGAAMLIKKDLFEKLGGFNEKYFLYYEDVDLCRRVREAGKKVYYYPEVSIKHLVGGTNSNKNTYKINYESSIKYHGKLVVFILQIIFQIFRLRRKL